MLCFVAGGNHQELREACNFFRFPQTHLKHWEKLCRRKDRRVNSSDRNCSCHFRDGRKESGPTLFPWNQGTYFDFPNPNKISRQCRQTEIGESAEPETNESILTDTEPVVENEVADEEHYYMQSYSSLVLEIKELEKQIAYLQTQIANLQSQKHPLTVTNVIDNEQNALDIKYYIYQPKWIK